MKKNRNVWIGSLITLFACLGSPKIYAADVYTVGKITNHSSIAEGLLIWTSGPLPTNCTGTAHGWMLIEQKHKTLISVTMAAILLNKQVAVYTNPKGSSTLCTVNQVDPEG